MKLNTASTLFNPKSCPVHFMLKMVFDFERISMGIALFKAAAGLIGLMILFSPLNLTPFSIILGSDIQVILSQRQSLFYQLAQNMTKKIYLDFSHADLGHADFSQSKKTHMPRTCCKGNQSVEISKLQGLRVYMQSP